MANVVFHIGFPKTATTTLQETLAADPNVAYFGKGLREATNEDNPSLFLCKLVMLATRSAFRDGLSRAHDILEHATSNGQTAVFSDEALTYGEHMALPRAWRGAIVTDHDEISDRLHALNPNARIIAGIREQVSFFESFYAQRVKRDARFMSVDAYVDHLFDNISYKSPLRLLEYDRCREFYAQKFGADSVLFFPFREAIKDYSAFLKKLAAFTGLNAEAMLEAWGGRHENTKFTKGLSARKAARHIPPGLRKYIPATVKRGLIELMPAQSTSVEFSLEQQDKIRQYFFESNARLTAQTGLQVSITSDDPTHAAVEQ